MSVLVPAANSPRRRSRAPLGSAPPTGLCAVAGRSATAWRLAARPAGPGRFSLAVALLTSVRIRKLRADKRRSFRDIPALQRAQSNPDLSVRRPPPSSLPMVAKSDLSSQFLGPLESAALDSLLVQSEFLGVRPRILHFSEVPQVTNDQLSLGATVHTTLLASALRDELISLTPEGLGSLPHPEMECKEHRQWLSPPCHFLSLSLET